MTADTPALDLIGAQQFMALRIAPEDMRRNHTRAVAVANTQQAAGRDCLAHKCVHSAAMAEMRLDDFHNGLRELGVVGDGIH